MTPQSTRRTRERLVEVARELFHQQGYGATGLAQILRTAEVNSGSLYHFFRGKHELLLAVLEHYKELLWPAVLEPAWRGVDDPIERIWALLDAYRGALLESEFQSSCPIGSLALELKDLHPEAHALIAENFEGWRQAVRGCLEDARARFPAGLERDKLATFVLTTMEGGVMQSRSYRSIGPFDDSVAMLRDYFGRILDSEPTPPKKARKHP
ncbi:MAG: TetR/AcrR family transcriptional regulator [bacterium]|nr:TetR/AcrR family transcriptional regulator [bacterium]